MSKIYKDEKYIKAAERIYEEADKISIPVNAKVYDCTVNSDTGVWVEAMVWIDNEWIEDES